MSELGLRCECGALRGRVDLARRRCLRLACYCRDCQALAWFLERPDEFLDANGGTEILQTSPARVEFSAGTEHIACMRMGPKGPLRWYASCCNTPVANTLAKANMPFAGVNSRIWDPELDEPARAALLGPVSARVNGPGYPDQDGKLPEIHKFPALVIARSIRLLAGSWLRNEHWPTPFFDADGEPLAVPNLISRTEREALQAKVARQYL